MYVTQLRAGYWRSWRTLHITETSQWNVLSGANGAGKTAILEIMWALHRQRSLRGSRLKTLRSTFSQQEHTTFAHVTYEHFSGSEDGSLRLTMDASGSTSATMDDEPVSKAAMSLQFPVVAIQPIDTDLILGDSQIRREFIHRMAFSTNPEFLSLLHTYESALAQRNSLLRDVHQTPRELHRELSVWDEIFCASAATLQREILVAFSALQSDSAELLARFVGPDLVTLDGVMPPGMEGEGALCTEPEFWKKLLAKSIEKDRRKGYTSVGPHRWDWEAKFEGISAKVGASFGQVRAITVALRLAAADGMARTLRQDPLVLLDDLNSEIDLDRRILLLQALADRKYQTWISTTDPQQVIIPSGVSVVNWHVAKQSLERRI